MSSEHLEAPAPAAPEDHLKVLPKNHEKQTKLRCSNGESSGTPEDSNIDGEGTGETALSSTTAKPAANPKTNPFFFERGTSPSRAAVSHPCRALQRFHTVAKAPRKVTEKHRNVNV